MKAELTTVLAKHTCDCVNHNKPPEVVLTLYTHYNSPPNANKHVFISFERTNSLAKKSLLFICYHIIFLHIQFEKKIVI